MWDDCVQTEAYYEMKQQAEKCWHMDSADQTEGWHRFTPCTNVQWIAYLCKILRYKKYKKFKRESYKGVKMTRGEQSSLDRFMFVPFNLPGNNCLQYSNYHHCQGVMLHFSSTSVMIAEEGAFTACRSLVICAGQILSLG
jgi:hypothetical protein